MAFLNVDPVPMMLPGFHRVLVQGRPKYSRVVIPRTPPANEDLTIVTITDPPPGLLEGLYELRVTDIQKSPFHRAQAFVRMCRVIDREALHNRGPNARRVLFNNECWLMLIGYPVDTRGVEDIRDTIKSFGRLICWQKDNVLARVIVKARVTDLEDIPHYLVLSEGDDFEGISHTVQVEIMQQTMLGGQLQDEDIPPPGIEGNFIFPGIGLAQPQNGNFQQQQQQQQFQMENVQPNAVPDLNDLLDDVEGPDVDEHQDNEWEAQQDVNDLDLGLSVLMGSSSHSTDPESSMRSESSVKPKTLSDIQVTQVQEVNELGGHFLVDDDDFFPDFVPAQQQQAHGPIPDLNVAAQGEVDHSDHMIVDNAGQVTLQAEEGGHQALALNGSPNDQRHNMHLDINIALLPSIQADPGWMMHEKTVRNSTGPPADLYRLWARYFSPVQGAEEVISIPLDWVVFFTVKLLSPSHFHWAKSFLSSQAWKFLIFVSHQSSVLTFNLPSVCPPNAEVQCLSSLDNNIDPNTQATKGRSSKTPIVETEARRSPRLKAKNGGFKNQGRPSKNCLACASTPPTLSLDLIQTMGSDLCKINTETLEVMTKPNPSRTKHAIGNRKVVSTKKERAKEKKEEQDAKGTFKRSKA
uniref:Uncharacterized protein n=1 Tax=Setaria viridis TaxID=4556 RepID=A0A4U6TQ94_SETVI|nr:hypothetical protein SEVIR_7G037500v2 [Setaria viridis]